MGIIVDLILILIVILNVFIGYKKGLIKVAFNILVFIIAIIATLILFKPVSNIIINNTEIDDNIKNMIISTNNLEFETNEINDEDDKKNLLQKYVEERIKQTSQELKKKAIESIAETISIKATEIITGLLLFIAIRIVLILLKFITETLANIPIIKQFNEVGGIIYGLAKSIIIIYLVLTFIFIFSSIKGNNILSDAIFDSYITKVLYENNPVIRTCLLDKNLL